MYIYISICSNFNVIFSQAIYNRKKPGFLNVKDATFKINLKMRSQAAYGSWQGGGQEEIRPRENKEQDTTILIPISFLFLLFFCSTRFWLMSGYFLWIFCGYFVDILQMHRCRCRHHTFALFQLKLVQIKDKDRVDQQDQILVGRNKRRLPGGAFTQPLPRLSRTTAAGTRHLYN